MHVCVSVRPGTTLIFICVFLRLPSPEWNPEHPNSFQQVVFAHWTHHVAAYAWEQQSTPRPSPTCLSLSLSVPQLPVTCILCFKAFNLFILFTRHIAFNLWWRNWSKGHNFPIIWLHKAEGFFGCCYFLYNVCIKMRCLLALEVFISSFAEIKRSGRRRNQLLTVNCSDFIRIFIRICFLCFCSFAVCMGCS